MINKYDPRLKKIDHLKKTFVCGEKILEELIVELKPDKKNELSRQSWIITGPRGAGKSHLLTLLYHGIREDHILSRHWLPLLFPEELFGVDSLYRLLIKIFDHIKKDSGTPIPPEIMSEVEKIQKIRITGNLKQKRQIRHDLAKELFQQLVKLNEATGKTIILMLENLQYLLRDQLSEEDIKSLRTFMNEHPGVFVIIGTALTVFNEISDYGKPFYHFFRIRSLESLERPAIIEFLLKLADYRGDTEIQDRIENNRRYIYLYQLLTGGNPRLLLFLYELLLDNETLNTYMVLEKIGELTPYFLDKTREESGQKKLILDALATETPAQTAGEIADYINEDYKSVSEQLKRLSAEGWIREIDLTYEKQDKKQVFYTLRDYFYRVWYKVRMKSIEDSDVTCLAELAVFLFEKQELEERWKKYSGKDSDLKELYRKSLELTADELFMKNIFIILEETKKFESREMREIVNQISTTFIMEDWDSFQLAVNKLSKYPYGKKGTYLYLGIMNEARGEVELALQNYQKSIDAFNDVDILWMHKGRCLYKLKRFEECYETFSDYFERTQELENIVLFLTKELNVLYLLKDIADVLFSPLIEFQCLSDAKSDTSRKYEAIFRLLLLDKFSLVTNELNTLLESSDHPDRATKKIVLILELLILDGMIKTPPSEEIKKYLKYLIRLSRFMQPLENVVKRMTIIANVYVWMIGKEHISQSSLKVINHQFHDEGVEGFDVFLKVLNSLKNPNSREAQQWGAEPLFKEIVRRLA